MSERWQVGAQVVTITPGGDAVRTAHAVVSGDEVCIAGRTRRVRRAPPTAAAVKPVVTPPMPAVVGRILVSVGEVVALGQGLVTVVAMKMELTLRAPHAGTVTEVRVRPGENVAPGQILVEVVP